MSVADEVREAAAVVFACPLDVASAIAAKSRDGNFLRDSVILRQGERAADSYMIYTGRAQAVAFSASGHSTLLAEYDVGDLFGALPGETDTENEAEIVAAEDVRTLIFRALDLLALAERHAAVGLTLSKALVRRLRKTSRRMVAQVTLSAAGRVHAELLRLGNASQESMTIRPAPVMTTLAARLSTTRETVSRTVSALERRGIVRREDGALVIAAPSRLESMVV
ncbi:MAG: Crp/Fnr family transcriptional regulator [Pacificimonas sp.]